MQENSSVIAHALRRLAVSHRWLTVASAISVLPLIAWIGSCVPFYRPYHRVLWSKGPAEYQVIANHARVYIVHVVGWNSGHSQFQWESRDLDGWSRLGEENLFYWLRARGGRQFAFVRGCIGNDPQCPWWLVVIPCWLAVLPCAILPCYWCYLLLRFRLDSHGAFRVAPASESV